MSKIFVQMVFLFSAAILGLVLHIQPVRPANAIAARAKMVLQGYYDALNAGNCRLAIRLRPGSTMERCRQVEFVRNLDFDPWKIFSNAVIFALKVSIKKVGQPEKTFDGIVTVIRWQDGNWHIKSDSYRSRIGDNIPEDYLAEHVPGFAPHATKQAISRHGGNSGSTRFPPPQRFKGRSKTNTPSYRPHSVQEPRSALSSVGLVFGDRDILKGCFGAKLHHRPGEERINATLDMKKLVVPRPTRIIPRYRLPPLRSSLSNSIRRVNTSGRKLVALTFDFCERNNEVTGYDGRVIDILRRHNVKATLYMGGKWMATHPRRTMQLIADPLFEMGNHAWTHGNLRVLRGKRMRNQVLWTQAQYEILRERLERMACYRRVAKRKPIHLQQTLRTMRYPYGTCSRETLNFMARIGLPSIQWDVVTADPWKGQSVKGIMRAVSKVRPGSIVIMHANGRGWKTWRALPQVIKFLRARGYRFVTVSELLANGVPITASSCYENRPGDNLRYDRVFGPGTTAKLPRRLHHTRRATPLRDGSQPVR